MWTFFFFFFEGKEMIGVVDARDRKDNSKLLAASTCWKKNDSAIEKKRREKDREK